MVSREDSGGGDKRSVGSADASHCVSQRDSNALLPSEGSHAQRPRSGPVMEKSAHESQGHSAARLRHASQTSHASASTDRLITPERRLTEGQGAGCAEEPRLRAGLGAEPARGKETLRDTAQRSEANSEKLNSFIYREIYFHS